MRIWRFHRLGNCRTVQFGTETLCVKVWEIAFSKQHMDSKLDGAMAEVIAPALPWPLRLFRWLRPMRSIEAKADGVVREASL